MTTITHQLVRRTQTAAAKSLLPSPAAVLAITPAKIRAAVGGDHNLIHTNPIAAKLFGFPPSRAR